MQIFPWWGHVLHKKMYNTLPTKLQRYVYLVGIRCNIYKIIIAFVKCTKLMLKCSNNNIQSSLFLVYTRARIVQYYLSNLHLLINNAKISLTHKSQFLINQISKILQIFLSDMQNIFDGASSFPSRMIFFLMIFSGL